MKRAVSSECLWVGNTIIINVSQAWVRVGEIIKREKLIFWYYDGDHRSNIIMTLNIKIIVSNFFGCILSNLTFDKKFNKIDSYSMFSSHKNYGFVCDGLSASEDL